MILPQMRGESLLSHRMSRHCDLGGWHVRLYRTQVRVLTATGTTAGRVAEPALDPARRKDRLSFLTAVSGADGHHALLSWTEIAPGCGRAPVLLAATLDDTPLDRAGPQLVLPQDRRGARHISGIDAIRVDGDYTSSA